MVVMKSVLRIFFFLVCIAITGYFAHLQFLYYIRNDDVASINYRNFNDKERDEYPIFTLCFRSIYQNTIFKKEAFIDYNMTSKAYEKYLSGIPEDGNHILANIKYDDVVFDIHDKGYLNFLTSSSVKGNQKLFEMLSIIPSFKDPYTICYSKNISFQRNVRYIWDYVNLNTSMLYNEFYRMYVYIHQRGQLLRSFNKPSISQITPAQYKTGMKYEFHVNDVEVLQRREGSNTPCNKSLTNEDAYALGLIMKTSNCIPAYWSQLAPALPLKNIFKICTAYQYRRVTEKYTNIINGFSTPNSLYLHPCRNMKIYATKTASIGINPQEGEFYFKYDQDYYTEIVNARAYSFETLVGQVGGFVGM